MAKKIKSATDGWNRFSKDRSFYFVYRPDNPNTWKLLDTGQYGIVQLVCIKNAARFAYMAGFRAGKREG
jgi:hypothetical protein